MKIVITGASGQLGKEIYSVILNRRSVLGDIPKAYDDSEVVCFGKNELDITNFNSVKIAMYNVMPDIIINCAAIATADLCEGIPNETFLVNTLGASNLAKISRNIGAKLVHISTDYVFGNITDKKPLAEWEKCEPLNIYGKSKLLAEEYVKTFCTQFFIIRTAWLYGYSGKNFVKTIISLAKDKKNIRVVSDQIGNPTSANELAHHILELLITDEYGIYHCTNNGECSWYDFATKILELYGMEYKLNACTTKEYGGKANRPRYSSLDNMMLRNTIGDKMRNWDVALESYIEKIKGEF